MQLYIAVMILATFLSALMAIRATFHRKGNWDIDGIEKAGKLLIFASLFIIFYPLAFALAHKCNIRLKFAAMFLIIGIMIALTGLIMIRFSQFAKKFS